jgi:hypothetical protein
MWCHMGQSCDTFHLPQILEKDVEVMATAFLHLSPLFICLSFFSLALLCCLLLQELHGCHYLD